MAFDTTTITTQIISFRCVSYKEAITATKGSVKGGKSSEQKDKEQERRRCGIDCCLPWLLQVARLVAGTDELLRRSILLDAAGYEPAT
jgi:hypothetical protein